MSSNPPPYQGRRVPLRWYNWHRIHATVSSWLLGWGLLLGASLIWFLLGARFTARFGPDSLATAAGVMVAVAVGVTLWRWSVRDAYREHLEASVCPRCFEGLTRFEEQPRPGALSRGLQGWRCENCGLEDAGPLTSARNAS